jgi:hypothetical protein
VDSGGGVLTEFFSRGLGFRGGVYQSLRNDAERFPLVVDSDMDKVGTFVPGTVQEIFFRDRLKDTPVDVIVIATQWRAKDIVHEIRECGILFDEIMLESDGRLVDYFREPRPYNADD